MSDLFYHGGPRGIKGGFILPPTVTNAPSCSSYGGAGVHRRDRVYVTKNAHTALLYACGQPDRGSVYVVEPIGDIEDDPDWLGEKGQAQQCVKARIISERPVAGKMMRKVRRQVLGVFP